MPYGVDLDWEEQLKQQSTTTPVYTSAVLAPAKPYVAPAPPEESDAYEGSQHAGVQLGGTHESPSTPYGTSAIPAGYFPQQQYIAPAPPEEAAVPGDFPNLRAAVDAGRMGESRLGGLPLDFGAGLLEFAKPSNYLPSEIVEPVNDYLSGATDYLQRAQLPGITQGAAKVGGFAGPRNIDEAFLEAAPGIGFGDDIIRGGRALGRGAASYGRGVQLAVSDPATQALIRTAADVPLHPFTASQRGPQARIMGRPDASSMGDMPEKPVLPNLKANQYDEWAQQMPDRTDLRRLPKDVWYHGTTADFDEFRVGGIKRGTSDWNSQLGIHFAQEPETAKVFAEGQYSGAKTGGRVVQARLHIANPKVYEVESNLADDAVRVALQRGVVTPEELMRYGPIAQAVREGLPLDRAIEFEGSGFLRQAGRKRPAIARVFRQSLAEQGHDGIVYGNVIEGTFGERTAIAFDPSQIEIVDAGRQNLPPNVAQRFGPAGRPPFGEEPYPVFPPNKPAPGSAVPPAEGVGSPPVDAPLGAGLTPEQTRMLKGLPDEGLHALRSQTQAQLRGQGLTASKREVVAAVDAELARRQTIPEQQAGAAARSAGVPPARTTPAAPNIGAPPEVSGRAGAAVTAPPPAPPSSMGAAPSPASAGAPPPDTGGVATAVAEPEAPFAGNIRLSKYPEDLRAPIREWADANPDAVQAARRGTRSDAQVIEDARALVEEVGGDFDKLQKGWKPGQAWNAEEVTAIRGALADSTRKVIDAADAARAVDSTENQVRLATAILEQQRLQQIVHGVTAEAGRSLRAFRLQADEALANGDVAKMQEILKRALGTNSNADIAELTEMIKALDINNPVAVNNFLRSVNKPGFWDYVLEFWYNSILSGPWTHLRNAIGNTASVVMEPVRRAGGAGVEGVLARAQGRPVERFWDEVPASVIGGLRGIPEGVRGALETLRYGFNPANQTRIELRKTAFPGMLGRGVRLPSNVLEATDAFFHAISYRMSLYGDAVRMARSEGLRGDALTDRVAQLVSDPPAKLTKQAGDEAERLLFRGDPGKVANAIGGLKNVAPVFNFVIPFVRTPTNLLKFGIRNSPLGLLDYPMWKRAMKGNPQASEEIAQTLMGSAVAAGFAAMVASGDIDITAGPPTNSAERDRFYREGKLPFAIKIPGAGWVQYNQLPGLDTTLTALAATVQGVRNGENVDDIAASTVATIGQSLLDRSYMSGLSDLMDAVGDPARFAQRYFQRQASGFVPYSSALRQTATAMDPTVRDPETIGEQFQANIPGLTGNVPPRLTAFGEPAQRGFPSPIQISPDKQTAVDAELERLGMEVGFTGKSIGGISLTREQQAVYQQIAGRSTYETLANLIASPRWETLTAADQEKVIDRVIARARDQVRDPIARLTESERWETLAPEMQQNLIDRLFQRLSAGALGESRQ